MTAQDHAAPRRNPFPPVARGRTARRGLTSARVAEVAAWLDAAAHTGARWAVPADIALLFDHPDVLAYLDARREQWRAA